MSLFTLVYVGTSTKRNMTDEQLDLLFERLFEINQSKNITGMLIYGSDGFMQVLEGEENAVKDKLAHIEAAMEQKDLIVLHEAFIDERSFDAWHMAYRWRRSDGIKLNQKYAPFIHNGFDESKINARSGTALSLLSYYSKINGVDALKF